MSIMRRWFPSFDGSAHVSPYLYVPPKRRWWPTLLAFAAGGICVLALLGPSQKSGVAVPEKAQRPLVFQVRPGDAVAAKDLASPPPAVAADNAGEVHAKSPTSNETLSAETVPVPQQPNAGAPASAMASVEAGNARIPPETRIVASPARPTTVRRYARQSTTKSFASVSARHRTAKKPRRYDVPSDGYAYDSSPYRRYRFAGERAYGGYWGGSGGYYAQRGGWFSGMN